MARSVREVFASFPSHTIPVLPVCCTDIAALYTDQNLTCFRNGKSMCAKFQLFYPIHYQCFIFHENPPLQFNLLNAVSCFF